MKFGTNWRAVLILLVIIPPLLPGLASSIKPSAVHVNQGILHLYSFNWLFGFCTSVALYWFLNYVWPAMETHVDQAIHGLHDTDGLPSIVGQDEINIFEEKGDRRSSAHGLDKDKIVV